LQKYVHEKVFEIPDYMTFSDI
jgi:hypothetical protein